MIFVFYMHLKKLKIARACNFFEIDIFEFGFGISAPKDKIMAGSAIGLLKKNGDHNPP